MNKAVRILLNIFSVITPLIVAGFTLILWFMSMFAFDTIDEPEIIVSEMLQTILSWSYMIVPLILVVCGFVIAGINVFLILNKKLKFAVILALLSILIPFFHIQLIDFSLKVL